MEARAVSKTVTVHVATLTSGSVIGKIIKANVPAQPTLTGKIVVVIGSFVIGALVSDAVAKMVDEKFDTVVNAIVD